MTTQDTPTPAPIGLTILAVKYHNGPIWKPAHMVPDPDYANAQIVQMFELENGNIRVFAAPITKEPGSNKVKVDMGAVFWEFTLYPTAISCVVRGGAMEDWQESLQEAIEDEQGIERPDEGEKETPEVPGNGITAASIAGLPATNGVS